MYRQLSLFSEEDDEEQQERKEIDDIDLNPLFERLAQSKFRSSFYLNAKDQEYIRQKGWKKIEESTREIIAKRLAPAAIPNDGGRRRCATASFRHSSHNMPQAVVAGTVSKNGTVYPKESR